jgi:hypothetical protein
MAHGLFNITDNFKFGGCLELQIALFENLTKVVSEVTTSQVDALNSMGDSVTLIDRDGVRYTISRVKDNTSSSTRGVESANSLHADVKAGHVEDFKHNLSHAFTVLLGVEGCLSHKDRVLFGRDTELIVEGMVPYFFHVVPILYDSMFYWLLDFEYTALLLGLTSNIDLLLVESNHNSRHLRPSYDGGENRAGGIVSGETCLAHS